MTDLPDKETLPILASHFYNDLPIGKFEIKTGHFDPRIHKLEAGYVKNDDGSITLIHVSVCPIASEQVYPENKEGQK